MERKHAPLKDTRRVTCCVLSCVTLFPKPDFIVGESVWVRGWEWHISKSHAMCPLRYGKGPMTAGFD